MVVALVEVATCVLPTKEALFRGQGRGELLNVELAMELLAAAWLSTLALSADISFNYKCFYKTPGGGRLKLRICGEIETLKGPQQSARDNGLKSKL